MTRRTLFLIGLLFELVAMFGLFIPVEILRNTGTPVTLRTIPVDPRSVLRGDYVILAYEAGMGISDPDNAYGMPIYVVLKESADGIYDRTRYAEDKPTLNDGEVCLRGVLAYQRVNFPDIAQYFVAEGLGRELEQAQNTRRLLVDAAVSDSCAASILGLRIGPEAPLEQPLGQEGVPAF